jgi:IS4 transposase
MARSGDGRVAEVEDVPTERADDRSSGYYARRGSTGPWCDGVLRIATNRLDVPAEIIALLNHYRWTIEIFLRFFEQILGCRHLLSRSQNGTGIQTYCAIMPAC